MGKWLWKHWLILVKWKRLLVQDFSGFDAHGEPPSVKCNCSTGQTRVTREPSFEGHHPGLTFHGTCFRKCFHHNLLQVAQHWSSKLTEFARIASRGIHQWNCSGRFSPWVWSARHRSCVCELRTKRVFASLKAAPHSSKVSLPQVPTREDSLRQASPSRSMAPPVPYTSHAPTPLCCFCCRLFRNIDPSFSTVLV